MPEVETRRKVIEKIGEEFFFEYSDTYGGAVLVDISPIGERRPADGRVVEGEFRVEPPALDEGQ